MAVNLRLATLRLRQKLNFRLVKLLLLVIYLAATLSFVVYNFSGNQGNGMEEFLVEVDMSKKNNFFPHLSLGSIDCRPLDGR